jgi:hypothetical protein
MHLIVTRKRAPQPAARNRQTMWRVRSTLAVLVGMLALQFSALTVSAQVSAAHREALIRYIEASRTLAIVQHFGLPIMIRVAAVERWGFDFRTLGADQILAMESKLEATELVHKLVELHARHLTAKQARGVAQFYESGPGQRILADRLRTLLPSTDPLLVRGLPAPTEQDVQKLVAFMRTPTGVRLQTVGLVLAQDLGGAQEAFADLAVERYVKELGLPNRRNRAGGRAP